jgi:hypothetical protein
MSQPNKFLAAGLKKGGSDTAVAEKPAEAAGAALPVVATPTPPETAKAPQKASRRNTKHIGAYFDPVVSRQLRGIALEEDSTVQDLMGEALDMLFQSRGKAPIASRPAKD